MNADRPCPHPNLAKARKFLKAAGFPNGFTIETIVETGEYATAVNEPGALKLTGAHVVPSLEVRMVASPKMSMSPTATKVPSPSGTGVLLAAKSAPKVPGFAT